MEQGVVRQLGSLWVVAALLLACLMGPVAGAVTVLQAEASRAAEPVVRLPANAVILAPVVALPETVEAPQPGQLEQERHHLAQLREQLTTLRSQPERAQAVLLLRQWSDRYPEEVGTVLADLAYHEQDPVVLAQVMGGLGQLPATQAVEPLLYLGSLPMEPALRLRALKALQRFHERSEVRRALEQALLTEKHPQVQAQLAFSLGLLPGMDAVLARAYHLEPTETGRAALLQGLALQRTPAAAQFVHDLGMREISPPLRGRARALAVQMQREMP